MLRISWLIGLITFLSLTAAVAFCEEPGIPEQDLASIYRSPVDLLMSDEETWAVTLNQTSNTLSLVDLVKSKVVDEITIGKRPTAIASIENDSSLLVTCAYSSEIYQIQVAFPNLKMVRSISIPGQPHGIAIDPTRQLAYVALTDLDEISVLNLKNWQIEKSISVGRWPRYLTLSKDGRKLAVGTSGDRGISIVDLGQSKLERIDRFVGLNIGHLALDSKTDEVYFPWMVYRRNPITVKNIQLGWVMASRLGRIRLDSNSKREAISLDPPGQAIADPHGIALNSDASLIAVTSSGTHELILLGNQMLPFTERGSTDHIDPELLADKKRFRRIDLGGRPMGVRIGNSNRYAYVANYLTNSMQIIDLNSASLQREIPIGPVLEDTLERRGEKIFYDARRSLDQWYSCHSCHYDAGTNAVSMDTVNDGTQFTFKSVPHLYQLDQTGPWTWHGWQTNLSDALIHSLRTTMLGPEPEMKDAEALAAYLAALEPPPNLPPADDATLITSIERGKEIFNSSKGACFQCHIPPFYTDGQIHDFGGQQETDAYKGFNTPSLKGVFRKTNLGHEGRSASLKEFLSGPHSPEKISGESLSEDELTDLIHFLRTL